MILSKILIEMGVAYKCQNEREFSSLGLANYNNGDAVCTFLEDIKYLESISSNVVMVITNEKTAMNLINRNPSFGVCQVEKPRVTFFQLHNYLSKSNQYSQATFPTIFGDNCRISTHSIVAEKNVIIGDNVVIEPFCVIEENTVIGDNCIIRAGCKIGSEGFEFKKNGDEVFGVKHVGGVRIGKYVEIQSNACVDKAIYPWDNTIISDYCKIDNLVHIAHGVKIDKRSMIVANASIGGRTVIGEDAWVGVGAQIRNGISIGNKARVNMGAVVSKSVNDSENVTGNFAIEHDIFIANLKKINSK